MAIFQGEQNQEKNLETVIGKSVKVEGNFNGRGDVVVEGEVSGTLVTENNLRVGPQAKIKAEVKAKEIYLSGEIRGNVVAVEKMEMTESAKLVGNLETKNIIIASGAFFNGKCKMNQNQNETVASNDLPEEENKTDNSKKL